MSAHKQQFDWRHYDLLYVSTFRRWDWSPSVSPVGVIIEVIGVYSMIHLAIAMMVQDGTNGTIDWKLGGRLRMKECTNASDLPVPS